ncbi:MAG: alpha/beta fold hydrolase [Gammaproteobacteria bacterium]|nr:alpha/beta fold hydrolase [Gammaproteobacteria bacterium]
MSVLQKSDVTIPVGEVFLKGILTMPEEASGIVIFAHGSGSSRLSRRNNYVADILVDRGFGTLLFDLLTLEEDKVYENRFNISLLTDRLVQVTDWLKDKAAYRYKKIAYFGASTGAAAALKAAAHLPEDINAVVSRGGRPDLVSADELARVKAPTLLVVGSNDAAVIEFNRNAYSALECDKKIEIVPGATHLFEEPGTLERVSELAANWCERYLFDEQA